MPIQRILTAPAGLPANLPQGVEHFVEEADGKIVTYMGPIGGGAPVKVSGAGSGMFCVEYNLQWGDIGVVSATVIRDDIGLVPTPLTAVRAGVGLYSIDADINVAGPSHVVADLVSIYVIDFVEAGPVHVKWDGASAPGWPGIRVFDKAGTPVDPYSCRVQLWYAGK